MSKKNVNGRSTSSHDNKKLRTRSMEKQRGMAFGFRKTATAVKKKSDTYFSQIQSRCFPMRLGIYSKEEHCYTVFIF